MPMLNGAVTGAPIYMSKHIGMRLARYADAPDGAQPPAAPPAPAPTPPAPTGTGDEPLGEGGIKALEAERATAKEWERRAKEAEAKVEAEAAAKLSDLERSNKERDDAQGDAATARAELAAYKLAASHGITEQSDIDLLVGISDDTQRVALAARLASKPAPKPDPVPKAGTGSNDSNPTSSMQAGRDLYAAQKAVK